MEGRSRCTRLRGIGRVGSTGRRGKRSDSCCLLDELQIPLSSRRKPTLALKLNTELFGGRNRTNDGEGELDPGGREIGRELRTKGQEVFGSRF